MNIKYIIIKKSIINLLFICLMSLLSCGPEDVKEINIGFIGPLSTRATDLGIGPSKAMKLAVEQYNMKRMGNEPKVNFYTEDDQWEKEKALPAYKKLRKERNIDLLFISNTGGTVAVQNNILKDNVIAINPLNNDEKLSSLNENTFTIAKSTEEANGVVGVRAIELGLKNVVIMHYPNDFMTRGAYAVKKMLDRQGIKNHVIKVEKGKTQFLKELQNFKDNGVDGYVFFGYKEFGFAMKTARDLGITAPFFGSTTLLDEAFFDNSEGAIIGTECTFFTPPDGNYVLAHQFLLDYENRFEESPFSVWPPMQAYDAMNLALKEIKHINESKKRNEDIGEWLKSKLHKVFYYQGICGNISIKEDGSSRGIYFSLYMIQDRGVLVKVKR